MYKTQKKKKQRHYRNTNKLFGFVQNLITVGMLTPFKYDITDSNDIGTQEHN